jgi:hypothetical protein
MEVFHVPPTIITSSVHPCPACGKEMRWSTVPADASPSGTLAPDHHDSYAYRCDDWHEVAGTPVK